MVTSLLAAAAPAFSATVPPFSSGVNAEKIPFDVPAQPLDLALLQYSRQAGLQIVAPGNLLRGKISEGFRGVEDPRRALEAILKGTGVGYRIGDAGTISIVALSETDRGTRRSAPADPAVRTAAAEPPRVLAQGPAREEAPRAQLEPKWLGEVLVTATRQLDTANRLPLSLSAITQPLLDRQGARYVADLERIVPELSLVSQVAGVGTFAIRGIAATTGAATTGVYLDDTALTKRSNTGAFQNNGAPLPVLFDFDRIEVLKGPQGTLYGGSSEGGTIRLITPSPSLTQSSAAIRGEVSSVKGGASGFDAGFSVGGPIVEDRLGFRASFVDRLTPGYIDLLNPYADGKLVSSNINWSRDQAARLAVAWAPGASTALTLAYYHSDHSDSGYGNAVTVPLPKGQTFTTPQVCFDTRRPFGASPSNTTPVPCPASAQAGIYVRPSRTYGPFDYLGGDATIAPYDGKAHSYAERTQVDVANLTLDRQQGDFKIKSILSYVHDRTRGGGEESADPGHTAQTTLENPGPTGFPLFAPYPAYAGQLVDVNRRYGLEGELRLAYSAADQPLSGVLGLFYSNMRTKIHYDTFGYYTPVTELLYGISQSQRYGLPTDPRSRIITLDSHLTDTELALFGEANYRITSRLKLIAGVRFSRVEFRYHQLNWGLLAARTETNPFSLTDGDVVDRPTTPKLGLEYEIGDNRIVYATAAKGFRAGGINPPLNPNSCAVGLAQFGLTVDDVPREYGPDSVWSYELGAKLRLLDSHLQLNGAVYRIDWRGLQTAISVQGCGQNWVQNGGAARSEGLDLQTQWRPVEPLTFTLTLGYTDARYLAAITGPIPLSGGLPTVAVNKGDTFGVPPWQLNLSGQYEKKIGPYEGYVRIDYRFIGGFRAGTGVGTGNYNPYTAQNSPRDLLNARVGVKRGPFELDLYSENLLNSRDKVGNGGSGQAACQLAGGAGCSIYATYQPFVAQAYQRPRTVGLQLNYRR